MEACQGTLKDETTEELVPVQKLCCFCIPQRLGIIVLALFKLMLSLGLILLLTDAIFLTYVNGHAIFLYHIIIWIAIVLDVFDIVIALIVIVSVCKKDGKIMKTYYIYSICILGFLAFMCCVIVYLTTENVVYLLIFLFIFFLIIIMQEYLNYLLRNEVKKLEIGDRFQLRV